MLSEIPPLSSSFNSQTNEMFASFDRLSVIQYYIAFGANVFVTVCVHDCLGVTPQKQMRPLTNRKITLKKT